MLIYSCRKGTNEILSPSAKVGTVMKKLIDKMQKAIDIELDTCKKELRVEKFKFDNAQKGSTEEIVSAIKIGQIRERVATLCYLSAICHE